MLLTSLSLSLLFVATANASPTSKSSFGDFSAKHAWVQTPAEWTAIAPAPAEHLLAMRIGLKQSNVDSLLDHLNEISDPAHERYGQHLSKEEVEALVRPHEDTVEMVEKWLEAHGIDVGNSIERSPAGDWIHCVVPVKTAEKMLGTKYQVFEHSGSANKIVRTLSYSLPRALHDHIDVVTPTTMFGKLHEMKTTSFIQPDVPLASDSEAVDSIGPQAVPTSCNTQITPSCLQQLYGTAGYVPQSTATNSIGIAGYLNEFASQADLTTFTQRFLTSATNATFKVTQINGGGNNQSNPGVEANLDIQTTTGITFPTPNIYYSTGGSPPFIPDSNTPSNTNEPYDMFYGFILNQTTIPGVISTSYGDDEQTVPVDFATRVCNQIAQLGARGTSVLYSSGDDGVGGGNCLTNDGTNQKLFQPAFPASCPFVTTVGGTVRVNPEVAVSFSGGGFSRVFARPSYQSAAVSTFLTALGTTNAGLFNTTGRAYPDVAAQGQGFQIVISGRTNSIGGTSASCPTVSSVITLLNDFRLANGKTTLGFLNPLLYANPSVLNDITSGSNPGCGTNGFTARAGWDPVTGLGTPNFPAMQAIV